MRLPELRDHIRAEAIRRPVLLRHLPGEGKQGSATRGEAARADHRGPVGSPRCAPPAPPAGAHMPEDRFARYPPTGDYRPWQVRRTACHRRREPRPSRRAPARGRNVKRLLKKHGYSPDKQKGAVKTVIEQAERVCRDWAGAA